MRVALAGLAVLVLAACGGEGETDRRIAAVPASQAVADPCRLLAPDEVEDVLETPVSLGERRSAVGALRVPGCEYLERAERSAQATPGGGDTGRRPKAAIAVLPWERAERTLAAYSAAEGSGGTEAERVPVDEPQFVPPHETAFVRHGAVAVVVDVGAYLHAHGPGAAERLRIQTRELATRAVERLAG